MWIVVDLVSIFILGLATVVVILTLWSIILRPAQRNAASFSGVLFVKVSLFGVYRVASLILSLVVFVEALNDNELLMGFLDPEHIASVLQHIGNYRYSAFSSINAHTRLQDQCLHFLCSALLL